ncbi:MAG: Hsp20/alpha crystallin family protein [bacterium]
MAIIKWSPTTDLDKFFDDVDGFFPTIFERTAPAINVYQTEKEVKIEASLPGIDPKKVDISIEGDVLTIKGETEKDEEIKEENYYRREIRRGRLQRSIMLPVSVKAGEAKAEFKNGILYVAIPKEEKAIPKRIEVKIKS